MNITNTTKVQRIKPKCLNCPMLMLCTRKELKKRGIRMADASENDMRSVSSRDVCPEYYNMVSVTR